MSKNNLIAYSKHLVKNPSCFFEIDYLNRYNVLHIIALKENDASEKEAKVQLVNYCLKLLQTQRTVSDLSNMLEYKDYNLKTPIHAAIDNENIYFLEVLSKIKNTNFNVLLWEILSEHDLPPVPIIAWILEHYFAIPLGEYPKLEYKSVSSIIEQAQSYQISFVTEIIIEETIELNSTDIDTLISKINISNDVYLVEKLIEDGTKFDVNKESFCEIVKKMVKSNFIEMYPCTIKFFFSNYNFNIENIRYLISEMPEIFLHIDNKGNNIFHKLAVLKNIQNTENFDNLLCDNVNTIAYYLNSHADNKKKYIKIYPKELFQLTNELNESPLYLGIKTNSFVFVKTFLNSQILAWDEYNNDILCVAINSKPNKKIKKFLQEYIFEKIFNIKEEDFNNPEKKDYIASVLIEKANSDTLVYIANIFNQNCWNFNFQSFSHMPERKTSGAGNTLLHKAVLWEYTDLVKVLLEYDANPNLKNKEGFSPFLIAAAQNNEEIIYLLSGSSSLNIATKDGNTPLHFFVMNSNNLLLESAEKLTSQKFDKEAKNNNGLIADDFSNLQYFNINITEDEEELIAISLNNKNDQELENNEVFIELNKVNDENQIPGENHQDEFF